MNLELLLRRVAPLALTLVATALGSGCGSTVEGSDDDGNQGTGGGGTGPTSSSGAGCEGDFLGDCPEGQGAVCVDGEWQCGNAPATSSVATGGIPDCEDFYADNCPEGVPKCDGAGVFVGCESLCPTSDPPPGTACDDEGLTCEVPSDLDCGPPTITITCVGGEWVDSVPRCLPLICRDLPSADQCEANGCRWQEPGCGENPLPQAGCYDIADCAPGSCFAADETCITVTVVPACATEEPACDSCAEEAQLCVPQFPNEEDGGDDGAG